ncbi:MAG: AMP-binding protein, partial [Pseudomonadota bacterium]
MAGSLEITALEGRSSVDFLEAAFAAYEDGRAFAIVRPGLDLSTYPGLNVAETVAVGARLGWARLRHQPRADDAIAQIVFTSGTEGAPKAIALSHRNLADVVTRLNEAMGLDASVREY